MLSVLFFLPEGVILGSGGRREDFKNTFGRPICIYFTLTLSSRHKYIYTEISKA